MSSVVALIRTAALVAESQWFLPFASVLVDGRS